MMTRRRIALGLSTPRPESGMGEPLQGKLHVLNPWPPIRRLWLRASEVRRRLSVAFPAETLDRLRRQQQQPPSQPSGSQGPPNSSGSSSAVSEHTQQQLPSQPQIAQELPTPRESLLSLSSDETDAQSFVTAQLEVPALASPIALQQVTPNHGPISGGEKIVLVGYGFREDQGLHVQFGESATRVKTTCIYPNILQCILPPCASARRVIVTLHSPGRPAEIQNEGEIYFKYEDMTEQFRALLLRVLDHQPQTGSPVDYNQSGNPLSPSSPNPPSASIRQSQHSPPVQTMATHRSQSQTLSTDLNQIITEDDIIHLFGSVPLEQYRNSINLVNRHGQNLAHLCTQLGYHRLLVTVVERGADIHAKDASGWTPMDFARLHYDEDAIDILEGDWEENIENIISTRSLPIDLLRRFILGGLPLNALTHDEKLREDTRETAAKLAGSMSADTPSMLSDNSSRKGVRYSVHDSQYEQSPDASTIIHKPEEMPSLPRDEQKCTLSVMSTPVLNVPASSSVAPFVAPFEVPPMQTREVDMPILASSPVILSKPKELEGNIDALRARYSTVHLPITLSQQIRRSEQDNEADNDKEDTSEFVESFKEGKAKAKPSPSPGLVSSPSVSAAIVPPVEEKKEKEKEQEKGGEETQEQTQEMTAVEAKEGRANTPPRTPATSLVGGAPLLPLLKAPVLDSEWALGYPADPLSSGRFITDLGYNLAANWVTPTKEKRTKTAITVSTMLDVGVKAKTMARSISTLRAPKKTGFTSSAPSATMRSTNEFRFDSTKPTTDERDSPLALTGGYLSSRKLSTWAARDLQTLDDMYWGSSWRRSHAPEPLIGGPDCPDLAQVYGPCGHSCLTVFLRVDDNGNLRCRYKCCSADDFRTIEDGLEHLRRRHYLHRPFRCLGEDGRSCGMRFYSKADIEQHQVRYHRMSKALESRDESGEVRDMEDMLDMAWDDDALTLLNPHVITRAVM